MDDAVHGKLASLMWENIMKTPMAFGNYEIRDGDRNLVSSGEGQIKEVLSEYLLKHSDSELFFKYSVQEGEVDLDRLGYWIIPKGEEEKEIEKLAESLRGYMNDEAIEDFKKSCKMDFKKRRKSK